MCVQEKACGGGQEETECAAGYTGRLCATCSDDHFSISSAFCAGCFAPAVHWVIFSLFLLGCILFSTMFVVTCSQDSSEFHAKLGLLRVLLNSIHLLQAHQLIYMDWGASVLYLLYIYEGFTSFSLSVLLSPCLFPSFSLYDRAISISIFPFFLLLLSLFLRVLTRIPCLSHLFPILLYFYSPYIVKTCMELVICVDMDSNSSYLRADLNTKCWTFDHKKYVVLLFLPMAIVYIVILPAFYILFYLHSSRFARFSRVKFLVSGYKQRIKHGELVWMLFKIAVIISVGLAAKAEIKTQLILLTALFYCFLSFLYAYAPYENSKLTLISILSLAFVTVSVAIGYFKSPLIPFYDGLKTFLECGLVVICVFLPIFTIIGWWKVKKTDEIAPETGNIANSQVSDAALLAPPSSLIFVRPLVG